MQADCPECRQTVEVDAEGFCSPHKKTVFILGNDEVRRGKKLICATPTGPAQVTCSKSGYRIA